MRHVVDEFVTIFGFDVDERTLNRGRVAVDRMRGQLDQGTRAANGMNTGVRNLVMGWVGLQTLIGGSRALVNANVELENLRAAMVVTTGSVEAADEAFAAVRQFALRSPDELAEVTRAYQTLVGVGVDPLEERLTRLGDTAAAMQVPLDTLVDATVRAATGEAEALRTISSRFGIRFKSENRVLFAEMGDDLVRVGNNAAEALAFIEDLGANRFAGAMEVRANTLAGRFSMLSDAATQFAGVVGEKGLNNELRDLANELVNVTGESRGAAVVLGRVLGGGLRALRLGLEWSSDNAHTLALGLAMVGGTFVMSALIDAYTAIREIGSAALWTQAKALLIPAAITAIVILVALLIDDLHAFMNGQDSLIGRLLERYPELRSMLGEVGGAFRLMAGDAKWAWERMRTGADGAVDAIQERFERFRAWFREWASSIELPEWLQSYVDFMDEHRDVFGGFRAGPGGALVGQLARNPGRMLDAAGTAAYNGRRDAVDLSGGQMFVPDAPNTVYRHDIEPQAWSYSDAVTGSGRAPSVEVTIENIGLRPDATGREAAELIGRITGSEVDRAARRAYARYIPGAFR